MVTITQADNGKTIELKTGDSLVVRLDENPTTGYRWAVEQGIDDIFNPPGSQFDKNPDAKTGAGGTRVFTFQALKPGKTSLKIKHWRAWQGDNSITHRFGVEIQVK
jgi:inhibitor of cysteine peptidase